MYAYIDDDTNFYYAYTNSLFNEGDLKHIVMSVDRTNSILNLYTNGVYDVQAVAGTFPSGDIDDSQPIALGNNLQGVLDEVMIFNSALTQIQAADLNNRIRNGSL